MGLYKYKATLPDGKTKESRITAKSEVDARARLEAALGAGLALIIRETKAPFPATTPAARKLEPKTATAPKPASPPKKVQANKPVAAKKESKLDKLLFRQDGKCFFCGKSIGKLEASIEHLQPKSSGGKNDDGNTVACCAGLNRALNDMSLKEKLKMVLEKAGHFVCPEKT